MRHNIRRSFYIADTLSKTKILSYGHVNHNRSHHGTHWKALLICNCVLLNNLYHHKFIVALIIIEIPTSARQRHLYIFPFLIEFIKDIIAYLADVKNIWPISYYLFIYFNMYNVQLCSKTQQFRTIKPKLHQTKRTGQWV